VYSSSLAVTLRDGVFIYKYTLKEIYAAKLAGAPQRQAENKTRILLFSCPPLILRTAITIFSTATQKMTSKRLSACSKIRSFI